MQQVLQEAEAAGGVGAGTCQESHIAGAQSVGWGGKGEWRGGLESEAGARSQGAAHARSRDVIPKARSQLTTKPGLPPAQCGLQAENGFYIFYLLGVKIKRQNIFCNMIII